MLILLTILSVSKISFAAQCFSTFTTSNFTDCKLIAPKFALHWAVHNDIISLGIQADQGGLSSANWFAFGLSEAGGMNGADIVVISKNDQNKWSVSDMFSSNQGTPVLDKTQDWNLDVSPFEVSSANASVSVVISRKLNTCDPADYAVKTAYLHHVIWAIGSSQTLSYHGASSDFHGQSQINFLPSDAQKKEVQTLESMDQHSFKNITIAMQNVAIPNVQTSYLCVNYALPTDAKYHVVEYIHHIIMYGCIVNPQSFGTVYDCSSMPRSCPTFMLAWAPGISTVDLPSEAGFPIGKDSVNWVTLQVHYNNPNLDAGVVDSSGMQVTYTPQLRPNDMGVFTLGSTDVMIPPNKSWSTNPSLCSSDCTSRFKGNVTLVGSFMHMHLLGYAINTKHIRAGAELPNVGSLQYYDFNHQGSQQVGLDTNTLVPGDSFITTCSYMGSNTTIYWGE
ncbi:hypothetical protein HK096_005686, partial [Nowakowskiella sp. JEL0078]